MSDRPGRARRAGRKPARLWHRVFGLTAGVWLLLLALTGSAIAFYDELDTWLNPDLRTVAASPGAPAPLDLAVANAGRALPGFAPTQIELPNQPGQSLWMLGRGLDDEGAPLRLQVFADPHSGAILGWRESGGVGLDRRRLADTLYGLHVDVLLGPVAAWLAGLVGVLWVIDHFVSAGLSFPRLARWRDAFRVQGAAGSLRRLFDAHRAVGLWVFPVTLILAVSGVVLSWPELTREAARTVTPVSERLHEHWPEVAPPARPIPLEAAMARVAVRARIDSMRVLPDQAAYAVRTFDARDVDDQGRDWTYVSMHDGRILGRRHDVGEGAGDAFFAWQYALHSGKAFGLAGRGLVALAGLVVVFVGLSGIALWARRATSRHWRVARRRS